MAAAETRETSYYEVALTNRQVVSGFVILLVGLLVSFLAGVLVGQRHEPPPLQVAESRLVDASADEPAPGVGRIDYFGPDGNKLDGPPPAAVTETAPPPTLTTDPIEPAATELPAAEVQTSEPETAPPRAEEEAGDVPPPPTVAAPTAETGPDGRPKWRKRRDLARDAERLESEFAREQAEGGPPAEVAGDTASPAAPAAAVPAPPVTAPEPVRPTTSPAPSGKSVFVVQVFSSSDSTKARKILTSLQEAGYPATLSRVEQSTPPMYRVRVGPYRDRPGAQKVADDLRLKLKLDTWITSEP